MEMLLALIVGTPLAATVNASTGSRWTEISGGLSVGPILSAANVDGEKVETLGASLAVAGEASYARGIYGKHLGLVGIARFGTWPDGWSAQAGEDRYRADFALGALTRWKLGIGVDAASISAALAFGPTVSWIDTPAHVSISEQYSLGGGLNCGLRMRLAVPLTGPHGVVLDFSGWFHSTWLQRESQVLGTNNIASQDYRFLDLQGLLTIGYVFSR